MEMLNKISFSFKRNFLNARYFCATKIPKKVKVSVKQGIVVGHEGELPNGNLYSCFKGIPYAVPPVGSLRFKSPVPLERFAQNELDCTQERDVAHQRDPINAEVVGSENCLFLNVYTPQCDKKLLPVMVFIHGGGFMFGSGNSDYYFPKYLMEEDVIVVTLNYRLGALGFLCLPEENIHGNAGLKDQRLALQWVQDNIANFNGDPKNVTLFGESAGAASVHLHIYSNASNHLFHKAILQSGSANMEWTFQPNADYKVRKLATLLGCKTQDSKQILDFLQSDQVTPEMLLTNSMAVLSDDERRRHMPFPFRPVIEASNSPDSIINQPLLELLKQENVVQMPLMMGYNSAEGIVRIVNALRILDVIDKDLERFIPRNLEILNDSQRVAHKIREFYFNGQALSQSLLNELTQLLGDYHFVIEKQMAARYHAQYQPESPLYFYNFNYNGQLDMFKQLFRMTQLKGTCHADELFYLFQSAGDEDGQKNVSPRDLLISQRLSKLWANFGKYGNPTAKGLQLPYIDSNWQPVKKLSAGEAFDLDYLLIEVDCQMGQNPDHERMQFWRGIYDTYKSGDYSLLKAKL